MNKAAWREWNGCPPGPRKQRLLDGLVRDNASLALLFVRRLLKHSAVHIELEDAEQAGMIGLLCAIRKYSPDRPTAFSTMAYWWVKDALSKELHRAQPIRRPRGTGRPFHVTEKQDAILARTGKEATAAELGVSQQEYDSWDAFTYDGLHVLDETVYEVDASGQDEAGLAAEAEQMAFLAQEGVTDVTKLTGKQVAAIKAKWEDLRASLRLC